MAIKKATKPTKTCNVCKKETVSIEKNFYFVKDTDIFPDNRYPICKQCLYEKWEKEGLPAFLDTLRIIDKPLLADKFEMANGDYKKYLTQIASFEWAKPLTFKDSTLFDEPKSLAARKDKEVFLDEMTQEELKEAQEYWGYGYSEEEYIWLTMEFAKYGFDPEKQSPSMEDLIAEICLTRLDMRNKRRDNKDVDKLVKTLNDLMTAAGIKPTQEGGTGNAELDAFVLWVKHIENDRPIPDPHPDWVDVDKIGKYVKAFFLYPWARLFNKQKNLPDYKESEALLDKYTVRPRETAGTVNMDDDDE